MLLKERHKIAPAVHTLNYMNRISIIININREALNHMEVVDIKF